ncbi:MAG TPA: DUF3175 domain-containing protein [Stellaceae bacterium]|nr:DUF3175 domain-containing protein [Stellaceae bacterium]
MATKRAAKPASRPRKWSRRVTRESDALDLTPRVFTWRDPKRIARSLQRSADRSRRRKAKPYQSAMSMLNFYINRGGRQLPAERRRILARTKTELRKLHEKKLRGTQKSHAK